MVTSDGDDDDELPTSVLPAAQPPRLPDQSLPMVNGTGTDET